MLVIGWLVPSVARWVWVPVVSRAPTLNTDDVLLRPASPISLPKKNTSLAGRPVLAVASTATSSHFCVMAPSPQINSTRSDPLTPAPARTMTAVGLGAADHEPGELSLPTLNVKSFRI